MNQTNQKHTIHILWILFQTNFILSCGTFGGGFVIVSLMKKKYVEELQWLEEEEMLDITAIAQSTPGPIPINASIILGCRMAGITGSLVAVLGTLLPPLIIISIITCFYDACSANPTIATALQVMRAGIAAVIFDVVYNLFKHILQSQNALPILLMFSAFILKCFFGISAIHIILICLVTGILCLIYTVRKERKQNHEHLD